MSPLLYEKGILTALFTVCFLSLVLRFPGVTIVVDPVGSATGSILLTLYDVPSDITGWITAGGSAETVTTTTEGQNGRLSFTGTVGQRLSVKVGAGPVGTVTLIGPDRAPIDSVSIPVSGNALIDTQTLQIAGTYSILVDYSTKNKGSVQVTPMRVGPCG